MQIENQILTIHYCKEIVNSDFRRPFSKGYFFQFILLQKHKQPLSKDFNLSVGLHESSTCFYNSSFSPEYFDQQIILTSASFGSSLMLRQKTHLRFQSRWKNLTVLIK